MASGSGLSAKTRSVPGYGLLVNVRALHFGEEWAKQEYGDPAYKTARLLGKVVKHKVEKTGDKRWGLSFPGDHLMYWFTVDQLLAEGAPLVELTTTQEQREGVMEFDLRSPEKLPETPANNAHTDEGAAGAPRVRRKAALRPAVVESENGSLGSRSSSEKGQEVDQDERGSSEEEVPQPAKQKRKVVMEKRPIKPAANKRVAQRLLDGASSGDEDWSDDDRVAGEGNPLEHEDEGGPSGQMHWEKVAEGDVCEDVAPNEFTGSRSRVVGLPDLKLFNPLQVFLMLVPLLYWEGVVDQTNLYAEVSRRNAQAEGQPEGRSWSPVTVGEILRWLGLVLAMALHPLPRLAYYWRTGVIGAVSLPGFGRYMSQLRFEQIKRYIHLNDNSQRPSEKQTREYRLWHLLPLINVLNRTFKLFYRLGQFVTFDERTIPIRNRQCPIRIYNPKKPFKFGIEVFAVVDSLSFYCWHQHVYDKLPCPDMHSVVVRQLAETLPAGVGHAAILDRGFTAPLLLRDLAAMGIKATGTCQKNRKQYPKEMLKMPKTAERGEVIAAYNEKEKMVAVAWKDREPVFFLSTMHGLTEGETGRRQGAERAQVTCPEVAFEYNKYKDGVDQFDKACLGQNYSLELELVSHKWWLRGFIGLIDSALQNAYILFKTENPEVARYEYMLTLQEQLVENTQDNMTASRSARKLIPKSTASCRLSDCLAFCIGPSVACLAFFGARGHMCKVVSGPSGCVCRFMFLDLCADMTRS